MTVVVLGRKEVGKTTFIAHSLVSFTAMQYMHVHGHCDSDTSYLYVQHTEM